jgi:aspartate-semialdehyde dehydrogenase
LFFLAASLARRLKTVNVTIIGVSTLSGENLLQILDERDLTVDRLRLFDKTDEAGRTLMFRGKSTKVASYEETELGQDADILFLADLELPEAVLKAAQGSGALVIDLFPARQSGAVLVVPEVNGAVLADVGRGEVVGSPAPASVAAALALAPLQAEYQVLRLNAFVVQSATALEHAGVEALAGETARLLNGRDAEAKLFQDQYAFNLVPQPGDKNLGGVSAAEARFVIELRELLRDEQIEIVVNVIQAPIFYGVMVTLQAETQQDVDLEAAGRLLTRADGLRLIPAGKVATPVGTAVGNDWVHLSGLRLDPENASGFGVYAMTDNLRKGSALNAVQIAEQWQKAQVGQ